jgi:hypothetical protein
MALRKVVIRRPSRSATWSEPSSNPRFPRWPKGKATIGVARGPIVLIRTMRGKGN